MRVRPFDRPSPISASGFVALVRARPRTEVLLALRSVQTVAGAERLYWAERSGKNRPPILRAATRRIAELGGEEPESMAPELVIAAESVDADRRRWERRHTVGGSVRHG